MSSEAQAALDEAQLERLYVKLEKPLYNVVYRWLWNATDTQDVVQEAFVRVWKMRDRVRMDTVEPLVYRVALNLASNRRRTRKLWQWIGIESLESAAATPGGDLESKERDRVVRQAVDGLPEELRQVVALCELGALPYATVAKVLGIPEGTVGSRRNKAIRLLRENLGPFMEEVDAN